MKCKELFKKIDELYPKYIDIWKGICEIESPSEYKAGVDAVGEYVISIADKLGFSHEIHYESVSGNAVMITMNSEIDEQPIVLSAHMDTVHPVGSFGENPVRIEGGRLYGPGAQDCKSGIVEALLVMHALRDVGFNRRPVILLLQSDEEVGSRTSEKRTVEFMAKKSKNAIAFLNLEGSSDGYVIIERKGIINYKLKVRGVAAHSAKCATEGASAIREAAHKIVEIEKIKDSDGITCNTGVIVGGSVPNTVAEECEFTVNVRFKNSKELLWIENKISEIAARVYVEGCTTEISKLSFRVPMEYNENNMALVDKINVIFRENELSEVLPGKAFGGSDAADMTSYGIPTVDSLGPQGGKIHSKDEYATLETLREFSKRVGAIVYCI